MSFSSLAEKVIAGLLVAAILATAAIWHEFTSWILVSTWHFLVEPVPVWRWAFWSMLGFIGLIIGILFCGWAYRPKVLPLPDYYAYRQRELFGLIWRWRWGKDGRLDDDSLRAFCPKDDMMLVFRGLPQHFLCEKCGTIYRCEGYSTLNAIADATIRRIGNDVRTEEWKQHVPKDVIQ